MEEINLNYSERMKERRKSILKIDEIKVEVEKWSENIRNMELKIKELNNEINNVEKEKEKALEEKLKLENKIKDLDSEYISKGIPVPSDGDYEIKNGLLGGKRDLNLKLIKELENKEIEQV
jgi:chromosome segregation ATPase